MTDRERNDEREITEFLHLLFNNLKPTPYYNICQTSVKSHLQTHPYLQKPNYGLHKSRTIANITKNLVPSDVYGKVRQEFYERRREKEWRSKGFLEDPMNEWDVKVDASYSEYKRLYKSPLPLGFNLTSEHVSTLKDTGTFDIQTKIMDQLTQSDVVNTQFNNWDVKNVLDGRRAYARLRCKSMKGMRIEDVINRLRREGEEGGGEYPGGEGVKSDMACCLLSEAVEVFIKRILVSTLSSCNDSLDLTSQRLHLMQKMNVEPPLGVEMGCDVGKQVVRRCVGKAKVYRKQEEHLRKWHEGNKEKIDDWGSISQNSLAKIDSMLSLSKMRAYDSETTSIKNDVARLERFLERGSSMPFGVVKGKVEVEERHVRMGVKEVMRMGEDGSAIGALAVKAGMSI
ncbi:hypothetical protein TrVE_jg9519 [Triparma verrucosa]|uniref:Uncharacterized protein n=1 Tax=Triparma verrucosa TaxID=1606542 RepID=A0A9W7BFF0_9STRA|nr:hypothetical protein TrVE_jg9519 [Triparma verrucosa]